MSRRSNYYGDVFGRFLEAAAEKHDSKIDIPKQEDAKAKHEAPKRQMVRTASRSSWMDHLCKFASGDLVMQMVNHFKQTGATGYADILGDLQNMQATGSLPMAPGQSVEEMAGNVASAMGFTDVPEEAPQAPGAQPFNVQQPAAAGRPPEMQQWVDQGKARARTGPRPY